MIAPKNKGEWASGERLYEGRSPETRTKQSNKSEPGQRRARSTCLTARL